MPKVGTYNFPDIQSGDTLNEITIRFTAHPSYPLEKVNIYVGRNIISSAAKGVTIVDAANWVMKINQQIIPFAQGIYQTSIEFVYNGNIKKTYLKGRWRINGR